MHMCQIPPMKCTGGVAPPDNTAFTLESATYLVLYLFGASQLIGIAFHEVGLCHYSVVPVSFKISFILMKFCEFTGHVPD